MLKALIEGAEKIIKMLIKALIKLLKMSGMPERERKSACLS
jgi:hypothetical protein